MTSSDRTSLRKELRARRNLLNPSQQETAAAWALRYVMKLPKFVRANHIALYIPADGELDPRPIAEQLWKMGKHCYLPVANARVKKHANPRVAPVFETRQA